MAQQPLEDTTPEPFGEAIEWRPLRPDLDLGAEAGWKEPGAPCEVGDLDVFCYHQGTGRFCVSVYNGDSVWERVSEVEHGPESSRPFRHADGNWRWYVPAIEAGDLTDVVQELQDRVTALESAPGPTWTGEPFVHDLLDQAPGTTPA